MEIIDNKNNTPPFYIHLVDKSKFNKLIIDIFHYPKNIFFELEITEYYRYFLFKNRVILLDENGVNLTEKTEVGVASLKTMESYIFRGTMDNPYIVNLKTLTKLGYENNIYYLEIGLRTYELNFDKKYTLFVTTNNDKSNEIVFSFKSPNFAQKILRIIQAYLEDEILLFKINFRLFLKKLKLYLQKK